MRRFSLRALLLVISLICLAGAVARVHFQRVERIRAIQHCLEQAGGRSICYESYRRFQYSDQLTFRIQLFPERWHPESQAWVERASLLLKHDSRHRVESLLLKGTELFDAAALRAAINELRPEELELSNLSQNEWHTIVDQYPCRSIQGKSEFSSSVPTVLCCDWIGVDSSEDFSQLSPKSTVQTVTIRRFLSTNELLSLQPLPSLRELVLSAWELDECDVCQLMSRWPGVKIHLECYGLRPDEVNRLEQAFEPWLKLDVWPERPSTDPFG